MLKASLHTSPERFGGNSGPGANGKTILDFARVLRALDKRVPPGVDKGELLPVVLPKIGEPIRQLVAVVSSLPDKEPGQETIGFPTVIDKAPDDQKVVEILRGQIRERIIQLVMNAFILQKARIDGTSVVRDYFPMDGDTSEFVDIKDLARLRATVQNKLLVVSDPDFDHAVADRKLGAIPLLERTAKFSADHKSPRAAIKWLEILADEEGTTAIADLKWQDRAKILQERVNEMRRVDAKLDNAKLTAVLSERFPDRVPLFKEFGTAYLRAVERLEVSPLATATWFHALLVMINRLPQFDAAAESALRTAITAIEAATQATDISKALNTFGKTLNQEAAAKKASTPQ